MLSCKKLSYDVFPCVDHKRVTCLAALPGKTSHCGSGLARSTSCNFDFYCRIRIWSGSTVGIMMYWNYMSNVLKHLWASKSGLFLLNESNYTTFGLITYFTKAYLVEMIFPLYTVTNGISYRLPVYVPIYRTVYMYAYIYGIIPWHFPSRPHAGTISLNRVRNQSYYLSWNNCHNVSILL